MRFHLLGSMLSGGVSFYRELGPWSYVARLNPGMQLITCNNAMWDGLYVTDWVMANGCHKEGQYVGLEEARYLGTKIWLDYDDAVGFVDWHSPRARNFPNEECQKWIPKCVELADVVTVSTQDIADIIGPKAVVIPNAWDHRMHKMAKSKSINKTVLWRGSDTHTADLAYFDAALEHLAVVHNDWTFIYLGNITAPRFQIRRELPNVRLEPSLEVVRYFRKMSEINPSVVIVPMIDTTFNRCRSNIAWIEATSIGATCVAPDWPSWNMPSIFRYKPNDLDDFIARTEQAMFSSGNEWNESRNLVTNELNIHKMAIARQDILYAYS